MSLPVANLRSLAASSSGSAGRRAKSAASRVADDDPLSEKVLEPVRRVLAGLGACVEVSKTILRLFFLSLPVVGPLGLMAMNMNWKPKNSASAASWMPDMSTYTTFWTKTFGELGNLALVAKVAVGLASNGPGDLPETKDGDMKGAFKAKLPADGAGPAADEGSEIGAADGELDPSLAEQLVAEYSGRKGAATKADPKAKKLSAAALEASDAKELQTALKSAEQDYRTFDNAALLFNAFAINHPKSKQIGGFRLKLDELSVLRDKAIVERATASPGVRLALTGLDARNSGAIPACLATIASVKAAAILRMRVTIQPAVPAYLILADVVWPQANSTGVSSPVKPPNERAAMTRNITACFPRQSAVGSVGIMYWSDPAAKALGPALSGAQSALIYTRAEPAAAGR